MPVYAALIIQSAAAAADLMSHESIQIVGMLLRKEKLVLSKMNGWS